MNFLDENGLGRLWAQIILKLNSKVPDGGTTGQILKKTETGTEWADAPQTVTIPETTALLKGDGVGGVAAATTDATPTQSSTNPVQSGGVYTALADKLNKTGDGSNVTAAFTAASSRENIATGENLGVLFGKIAKWFSDLGSLAFKSSVTKSDVGLDNVDNVKQYSASNPPPYPVASVNGMTGNVTIKPKCVTVTLSSSGWDSTAKTQTAAVSGVSATETDQLITLTPALASQTAYYEAGILCTGQAADSLTFTATTVPTSDLKVYVVIQDVVPPPVTLISFTIDGTSYQAEEGMTVDDWINSSYNTAQYSMIYRASDHATSVIIESGEAFVSTINGGGSN